MRCTDRPWTTGLLLGAALLILTAQAAAIEPSDVDVRLDLVATGLTAPVTAVHAGDGTNRLFIVDQIGVVWLLENGVMSETPFLDLRQEIAPLNPFFDERGLLGLAFHPDFSTNGRLFARYSRAREGAAGEPCLVGSRGCHDAVVAEFSIGADPNRAEPNGRVILEVQQPQFNHNSGTIAFGPDGYLYVGLGDGGGAHDGLADDPPSHGPIGHGQNLNTLLGSILRIDVDSAPEPGLGYAIPETNPFVGRDGRDEIYAYGFRNPYRFSFDESGMLLVGDVGQNLFEEVDLVQRGGNYGWVTREGFACFDPQAPLTPPEACAATGAAGEPLLDPIAAYDHAEGVAIVGGHVYRGSAIPELYGRYVFGDFTQTFFPASGRLFVMETPRSPRLSPARASSGAGTRGGLVVPRHPFVLPIFELGLATPTGSLNEYLLGFGRDRDGEIYVLTSDSIGPAGNTGKVYRLLAAD